MRSLVGALIVLAATGQPASGDEAARVRAFIEPSRGIDEARTVRLVVEIEGERVPEVGVDRLPRLTNLKVVAGPSTRQSTSFRSFGTRSSMTTTKQVVYTLLPEGPGPAEIPSIEVRVGSEVRRTEPIAFEVRAAPPGPPRDSDDADEAGAAPAVYLEASLVEDEVWVGQAVTLEVTLYANERIGNVGWLDVPSFTNFWVENLDVEPNAEAYRTSRNGTRYVAYPLERKILVPTTPGRFSIEPYAANVQVRRSSGDLFDVFAMNRYQTVTRKTRALSLQVRELPERGRPDEFSGVVGSFDLSVELDRNEAKINEAIALRATLEGRGFLKTAPPPVLAPVSEFKVFDSDVIRTQTVDEDVLRSTRTWEWIIVPLGSGELPLPRVRFSYFDPEAGEYRMARADPGRVAVAPGGEGEPSVARGEVRLQRRDIAFIKPLRGRLSERSPGVHRRAWFAALVFLPVALVPLVVVWERQRARYRRDRGLARARRARARARRRLKSVGRRVGSLDTGAFHEEVARALVDYVADRFDRSAAGLTYDEADGLLGSRGVPPELSRRFRSCLERCDFARFVPSAAGPEPKGEILREASEVVERLEKVTS